MNRSLETVNPVLLSPYPLFLRLLLQLYAFFEIEIAIEIEIEIEIAIEIAIEIGFDNIRFR